MFLTLENKKVSDIYGYTEGFFTINLSLIRHVEWRKGVENEYGTVFFDFEHRVLAVGKENCDKLRVEMTKHVQFLSAP